MKKVVIFLFLLIVILVTGFFVFLQINIPAIAFAYDSEGVTGEGNNYYVKRLYSSEINADALAASIDNKLYATDFTEDEIFTAALAAGKPQFLPAFYYYAYKTSTDEFYIKGLTVQELAKGQKDAYFKLGNLRLEAIASNGLVVDTVTINNPKEKENELVTAKGPAAIISEDGSNMTVPVPENGDYVIKLKGTGGNVMLQYSYDVDTTAVVPQHAVEKQILIVNVELTIKDGRLATKYTKQAISSAEDME